MALELFDLTGKVALVTGGSRGLGEVTAMALGKAGADVAVCGRNKADLDRVYRAMILRGYGQASGEAADEFQAGRTDAILLAGLLFVATAFVGAEVVLSRGGI